MPRLRLAGLRLGDPDFAALALLSRSWGLSRAAVVRLLLRDAARRCESGGLLLPPVVDTPAQPGVNGGCNDETVSNK